MLAFCRLHRGGPEPATGGATAADKLFMLLRSRRTRKRRKLLKQARLPRHCGGPDGPGTPAPRGPGPDPRPTLPQRSDRRPADARLPDGVPGPQGQAGAGTRWRRWSRNSDQVLRLAALLRVAEALDFSRSQTTEITGAEDLGAASCEISWQARPLRWMRCRQPNEPTCGAGSSTRSCCSKWPARNRPPRLRASSCRPARRRPRPAATPAQGPVAEELIAGQPEPLLPDEPMSEAGRKLLRLHSDGCWQTRPAPAPEKTSKPCTICASQPDACAPTYGVFAEYFDEAVLDRATRACAAPGAQPQQSVTWMCCSKRLRPTVRRCRRRLSDRRPQSAAG